ncbi:hypothetical protein [Actinomyces minihominis]|uniref:hypothetical protein n=1 Tax=Actinomyces minihominis TaxID=2002838 RepID=UPI00101ADA2E|nr:hypothetical protein [Actinomyces minihominis]
MSQQADSKATNQPDVAAGTAEGEEDSERRDPWFAPASEVGLTAGLVTLLIFLRIFAVAWWDWSVAAALAESFEFNDSVSILVGTLFERPTLTGLLIIVALPLALFRDYWLASHKVTRSRIKNAFLIVALIAMVYVLVRTMGMWWVAIAAATASIVLVIFSKVVKHVGWNRDIARFGAHVGGALALALVSIAATIDTPWVSEEYIETTDGIINGYVLETEPGFVKILSEQREILFIPDEDVISRTLAD